MPRYCVTTSIQCGATVVKPLITETLNSVGADDVFLLCTVGWNLWNDHVLSWWKHRDDPNLLFLKYEDMHKVCCSRHDQTHGI